jgi:hypothetical protein
MLTSEMLGMPEIAEVMLLCEPYTMICQKTPALFFMPVTAAFIEPPSSSVKMITSELSLMALFALETKVFNCVPEFEQLTLFISARFDTPIFLTKLDVSPNFQSDTS